MSLSCPLCNEPGYTIVYKKMPECEGAEIVRCENCFHIYTWLDYEPDYEKLYGEDVYKVTDDRKSIFDKILTWEYKRITRQINLLKNNKGNLLDFGCGKGKFANISKRAGWYVKGVETSRTRAAYAKEVYNIEVSTDNYFSGKIFENDFDVITLLHVLEHLPGPKLFLTGLIKGNLKKGGLVVIEVPNVKSWQSSIAGNKWMHLDACRHISHFNRKELEKLTSGVGLKTFKTRFFSFHLGVLGMVDSILKLFGYKKNIIIGLKQKKAILIAGVILLLPVSFLLEGFSSFIGRGGIIRKYAVCAEGGVSV